MLSSEGRPLRLSSKLRKVNNTRIGCFFGINPITLTFVHYYYMCSLYLSSRVYVCKMFMSNFNRNLAVAPIIESRIGYLNIDKQPSDSSHSVPFATDNKKYYERA